MVSEEPRIWILNFVKYSFEVWSYNGRLKFIEQQFEASKHLRIAIGVG
jgi:hypothetical protein